MNSQTLEKADYEKIMNFVEGLSLTKDDQAKELCGVSAIFDNYISEELNEIDTIYKDILKKRITLNCLMKDLVNKDKEAACEFIYNFVTKAKTKEEIKEENEELRKEEFDDQDWLLDELVRENGFNFSNSKEFDISILFDDKNHLSLKFNNSYTALIDVRVNKKTLCPKAIGELITNIKEAQKYNYNVMDMQVLHHLQEYYKNMNLSENELSDENMLSNLI